MAADVLSGHFAIAGGRFIAAIENVVDDDCDLCRWNFIRNSETWCREKSIDNNAALCRWAFAKWGTRFNKCDRNPVIDHRNVRIFNHECIPIIHKKRIRNHGRWSPCSLYLLVC